MTTLLIPKKMAHTSKWNTRQGLEEYELGTEVEFFLNLPTFCSRKGDSLSGWSFHSLSKSKTYCLDAWGMQLHPDGQDSQLTCQQSGKILCGKLKVVSPLLLISSYHQSTDLEPFKRVTTLGQSTEVKIQHTRWKKVHSYSALSLVCLSFP